MVGEAVVSNGFSRKSTAPELHASTASGTSPWPVMNQDRKRRVLRFHPLQKLDPVEARHPYVGDHAAEGEAGQGVEEGLRVVEQRDAEAGGVQQEVERVPHRLVVRRWT